MGQTPDPTMEGGSIPIVSIFQKRLRLDPVLMGFGLDEDAIHSPNESFGLFNYYRGIETITYFHQFLRKWPDLKKTKIGSFFYYRDRQLPSTIPASWFLDLNKGLF